MKTNLFTREALKKLKGLLDEINICVFTTGDDEEYKNFSGVMPTTKVEEDGTIWFFTSKKSRKVNAIGNNSAVHLMYAHPSKGNYIDVWGNALMVDDNNKMKELWSPLVKAWFPNGHGSADICLIKVLPQKAHYWNGTENTGTGFI